MPFFPIIIQLSNIIWYRKEKIEHRSVFHSLVPGRCGCNFNWAIFKQFSDRYLNSLAPGRFEWNFTPVIFNQGNFNDLWLEKLSSDECHWTLLIISQHWFRSWLGAVRHQAITWANVDPDLSCHMPSPRHKMSVRKARSVMTLLGEYHRVSGTWCRNPPSTKMRTCLPHTTNTMAADDLATHGARTSAVMWLIQFVWIFCAQRPYGIV